MIPQIHPGCYAMFPLYIKINLSTNSAWKSMVSHGFLFSHFPNFGCWKLVLYWLTPSKTRCSWCDLIFGRLKIIFSDVYHAVGKLTSRSSNWIPSGPSSAHHSEPNHHWQTHSPLDTWKILTRSSHIHIYIYLEPKWSLFWMVNLQFYGSKPWKQGSFRFQVY